MTRENYGFYDWAKKWFYEENLPNHLEHLDSLDTLLDNKRKPSKTHMEQKNTFSFRTLYDGVKILNEIYHDSMANPKADLVGPISIESYDDFKNKYIPFLNSLYNCDDVVGLLNHKDGIMKIAYSKLKNHYEGIDLQDILDNLPDDFMDNESIVPKATVGSGTQAILLTTKKYPVDGVEVKSSEYLLGPKVLKMSKGAIEKESFAKSMEYLGKGMYELTIEEREYDVSDEGKILDTKARNCYISYRKKDDGKFKAVGGIYKNPISQKKVVIELTGSLNTRIEEEVPYEIFSTGADPVAVTGMVN